MDLDQHDISNNHILHLEDDATTLKSAKVVNYKNNMNSKQNMSIPLLFSVILLALSLLPASFVHTKDPINSEIIWSPRLLWTTSHIWLRAGGSSLDASLRTSDFDAYGTTKHGVMGGTHLSTIFVGDEDFIYRSITASTYFTPSTTRAKSPSNGGRDMQIRVFLSNCQLQSQNLVPK
ncbi:hypothetical protein EJB05_08548, partial [Eragrostis curvula]